MCIYIIYAVVFINKPTFIMPDICFKHISHESSTLCCMFVYDHSVHPSACELYNSLYVRMLREGMPSSINAATHVHVRLKISAPLVLNLFAILLLSCEQHFFTPDSSRLHIRSCSSLKVDREAMLLY